MGYQDVEHSVSITLVALVLPAVGRLRQMGRSQQPYLPSVPRQALVHLEPAAGGLIDRPDLSRPDGQDEFGKSIRRDIHRHDFSFATAGLPDGDNEFQVNIHRHVDTMRHEPAPFPKTNALNTRPLYERAGSLST